MTATPQDETQRRKKTDWEAVERDYRATSLSLKELGIKHDCKPSAIANQAKRKGWQRDLTDAVKHATSARLIQVSVDEAVQREVGAAGKSAAQATTDAVLAAAEVNVRVITSHRKRLAELHDLVASAKAKLEQMGDGLVDVREAAVFVQAAANLAGATKTLIEQERKAFGLDDAEGKDNKPQVEDFIEALRGKTEL